MAVNDDEWKALRGHVSSGFSRPSTVWTELKFKLMFGTKNIFLGHLVGSLLVSSVISGEINTMISVIHVMYLSLSRNETQKQFRICSPWKFSGSEAECDASLFTARLLAALPLLL